MCLRKLKLSDAPLMLEWMQDENVTHYLRGNFASKTLGDAEGFIRESWTSPQDINLAVTDPEGVYMGTVSLKHIHGGSAEFAIAMRSVAMGRGYAWTGMRALLQKAFDELGLRRVYWCVSCQNGRAVRFYEKHGFRAADSVPQALKERYGGLEGLKWYAVESGDVLE